MPDYLLGGPKIPYPWEILSSLLPNFGGPSPAPANSSGQNVESYQFPFSQLTPESMKLGMNAPPVEKPIAPPPTPGVNLVTPPPAPAPKSPVELARAEAESLYQQHIKGGKAPTEFGLPWDFFTKHGDISGGVFVGPQGPKFLFNENKPQSMMDTMAPLIQKYVDQMNMIQSGNLKGNELAKALWATPSLGSLMGPVSHMMTAETGQAKVPAEIANLWSQANKPQIAQNVFSGPSGQQSTLLIPPLGGAPRTLATGMPLEHGQGITGLINQGYIEFMKESAKIDQDPLIPADQKVTAHAALQNRFRDYANGIQQMLGVNRAPGGPATPGAATKPSWQTWFAQAKQANPGRSEQELLQYYQQKYGR